jgi:hypothetical protein
MSPWSRRAALSSLLLALGACEALSSCQGCGSGDYLATLMQTSGTVDRDLAKSVGYWSTAQAGATFRVGDGLRTGHGSVALVDVRDAGQVRLGSDTTIRFRANAAQKPNAPIELALDVETGEAVIEAGKRAVPLRTRFGLAVLEAGAQLRIRPAEDGQQRYQVDLGNATFFTEQGETMQVPAGRSVLVGIGLAELDPQEESPAAAPAAAAAAATAVPDAGAASAEAPVDAGEGELATEAGADSELAEGLAYAELTFGAGQSVTVFDPEPPSVLGVETAVACPAGAELRLGKQRLRGATQINLSVPAGLHGYQVACTGPNGAAGRVVARGRVRVIRNAGTRRLPTTPPTSRVDTDGRRYTVMYQSLRPNVVVRWPNAPEARGYTLFVRAPGGSMDKLDSARPELTLEPGKLADGVYAVFFTALDSGGKRSKETTIAVSFDNAAPMASLQEPPSSGFTPGASVRVAGVSVLGSSVSVAGQALDMDAQGRFQGEVSVAPDQRAVAIRFQHPQHGVRYYLRRAAGAAR